MADFLTAHNKQTKKFEGGYANVIGDRGKETYCGISFVMHPDWVGWPIVHKYKAKYGLKHNEIINDPVLDKMVLEFYKKKFWDVIGGDAIEDQLTAERLYDFGVTSGQSRSLKQIQEILKITPTGKADKATLDAINNPSKYLA